MSSGLEDAGALATAGLAAGAIEGERRGGGAHDGDPHGRANQGACLNCGATLQGAYCQACGQAAHVHRSLLHLIEELLHGLFHFDAKGWRTLPLLVTQPGVLTRRYVDGQRMRYVSPLALFLFTVFLMFFAASLSSGPPVALATSREARAELEADLAKANAQEAVAERNLADAKHSGIGVAARAKELAAARSEADEARMALQTVDAAASAIAARAAASGPGTSASSVRHPPGVSIDIEKGFGVGWLDRGVRRALADPELTLYKLKGSAYKYSFMLVPISLPFVWLLFAFRRGTTMYEHAVFVLYSLSFMSLLFVALVVLGAAGVSDLLLIPAGLLVPPTHMALQLRGTYGLGLAGTLWRTAALVLVAGVVFSLFVMFVAYVALA